MKSLKSVLIAVASATICVMSHAGDEASSQASKNGIPFGAANESTLPPPSQTPIKHIVILFQENRTTDNLFHGLKGADTADTGMNSKGQLIQLEPMSLAAPYGLQHGHHTFYEQWDHGKLDGANRVSVDCTTKVDCPPPNPQFKFVPLSEAAPYFQMAETYAFADHMFQSNQGGSFPAHQYIIAGTSTPGGDMADLWVSGNPKPKTHPTGCIDAPPKSHVATVDQSGHENFAGIYPCLEHQTVIDLLVAAGKSWKYYAPRADGMWTAPAAIEHLRTSPDFDKHVVTPPTQVLTDIGNGKLENVTWVIPFNEESDHAGSTDGSGPSWVASVVNAIGNSPFWDSTAILITWDDWGGWYDHVQPPIHSVFEDSFRVPLVIVSPWAKKQYVSKVTHNFGSIVHFIESTYGLGNLGYEDAIADDLSDCFDFGQALTKFQQIKAPLDANYFLTRPRVATSLDPDDD